MWISSYFIILRENFSAIDMISHIDERSLDAFKDFAHHLLTVKSKTQVSTALIIQPSRQVTGQVL